MKLNNVGIIVACDGPASSGKSTGAKLISKKYKLHFLSSGLLYRFASYLIIKYKPKKKILFLKKKFKNLNNKYINHLNLHTQEISDYTAILAKQKKVRLILRIFQKKFAKKYKCEAYTSIEEMALIGKPDIVSICSNEWAHYEAAIFFLKNGVDVFTEKIMATKYKDAKEMVEIAKKYKRVLGVNYNYRFLPGIKKLKDIIEFEAI